MTAEADAVFARFKRFKGPNASNVTRHRLIDDWLRDRLRNTPDLRIILLGAGFDTRAFRLAGGRWIEFDQPAIITVKEAALPASGAPNSLQRIAIDFATGLLAERLAPWVGEKPITVVIEGVATYLRQAELRRTLDALVRTFPKHVLICDLMTAKFVRLYSGWLRRWVEEMGGRFGEAVDDPAGTVIDAGYRQLVQVSIIEKARELGAILIPRPILNTLLRGLRDGYRAYIFEAIA